MYEAGQPKTDGPAKLSKLLIQATEELVKATALLKDILQCLEDTLDQTKHISDTLNGYGILKIFYL